jgi:transcriptional regulator with XRE-family HTH domain
MDMEEQSFGQQLARLRRRRGLSQQRLADLLCAAAGVATVSRHEVSRWERGQRLPAQAWLSWLAQVLGEPLPRPTRSASARAIQRWNLLRRQLRRELRRAHPID